MELESYKEAWEANRGELDSCNSEIDNYKLIRGFFSLFILLRLGVEVAGGLPLLPTIRDSPRGVLNALVRAKKRAIVVP